LALISLLIDERVNFDYNRKTHMEKALYESVRQHIEKKNDQYASKANKRHKHVIFQQGY
jgi:hypothetical protein